MAKQKIQKTNVARLLDAHGVSYELVPYEVDEFDLSATHVAMQLGEDVGQVFKTIVIEGDRGAYVVCVIPGDKEVDLKKIARTSGHKSCQLVQMSRLLGLTGYVRGGCSPIGMKKLFPTYFDRTCLDWERIYVSAGVRGLQMLVAPSDLLAMTRGDVADLT